MENLTLVHKVIKPHTADPIEGHTVVIFEKIGDAGEEYRFEIEPGMRVPKTRMDLFKWLRGGRGGTNYFAYAVTNDPELRLKFSTPVKMDTQAHNFILVTTLAYTVAEPRLIVTRRNDDPLRKLRDEIGGALQRQLAGRSWISIRGEFREIAQEAVEATLEQLRQFAGRYGMAIQSLSLACELEENDFVDVRHEAVIEQQTDIHRREASFERLKISEDSKTSALRSAQLHEEMLRHKKREHEIDTLEQMHTIEGAPLAAAVARVVSMGRIGNAATDAAVAAIGAAGGSIRTPAELLQAFTILQTAVTQSRGFIEGNGDGAITGTGMPLQISGGQNGAGPVIAEMFTRTGRMTCTAPRKQQLQSAILHLVGELLLGTEAIAAVVHQYTQRVGELRAQGGLAFEDFDYLRKFTDAEQLRDALQ